MKKNIIIGAMLLIAIFAINGTQFSSGPPASRTGAPNETTCSFCHFGGSGGTGTSQLIFDNGETTYVPGQTYQVRLIVQQANTAMFGFEMTALDSHNEKAGTFASPNGSGTELTTGMNRQYILQTTSGTTPTSLGEREWIFEWTAPSTDLGEVTFYLAWAAANGDESPASDDIHTLRQSLMPAQVVADVWPGDANIDGVVNIDDYFLTASAYGNTGTARNVQGITWQAYTAPIEWSTTTNFQGTHINNRYIDSNGDGQITLFDVAATIINRNQNH